MTNYSPEQLAKMSPKEFRSIVRKGEFRDVSLEVCQGHVHTAVVILPKEYALEFVTFCNRNPRPCMIVDISDVGSPEPSQLAPGADLRTDVPKYRVYKNGEMIDEPTDIIKYWQDQKIYKIEILIR